jgi:hypothetical protein
VANDYLERKDCRICGLGSRRIRAGRLSSICPTYKIGYKQSKNCHDKMFVTKIERHRLFGLQINLLVHSDHLALVVLISSPHFQKYCLEPFKCSCVGSSYSPERRGERRRIETIPEPELNRLIAQIAFPTWPVRADTLPSVFVSDKAFRHEI